MFFEIMSGNAPHGKHTVRAAGYARPYTGAGANPYPVLKGDVAYHQVEGCFLVVVVATEQ